MTKQEKLDYLRSTGLWEEEDDLYYEDRMLDSQEIVTIKDLTERFIDIDREFNGRPWNLLQILANIRLTPTTKMSK